jgi:hypothetical protein
MTAQLSSEVTWAGQPTVAWPVRSGAMPPLVPGFVTRTETDPGLVPALVPGGGAVLVPSRPIGEERWPGVCGKTQLAVHFAESLWRSGEVELLAWVTATSRASVISGYAEAADAVTGGGPAADGEAAAARFVSWLRQTSRPWLVVLDDLSDAADLAGLWPAGKSGRVLITTSRPAGLPAELTILPVRELSLREAMRCLTGRLTQNPDQRLGSLDLVTDLDCEPLALAQAGAVIAESALSCQDYRQHFARRREQMAQEQRDTVAAAAVTWTFSFEQAGRLSPDGVAQYLVALTALLDGHAIPGAVFTAPAARQYLADSTGRDAVTAEHTRDALLLLARQCLLDIDTAGSWPTVRMSRRVQEAVRALMPAEMLSTAALVAADALLEAWPGDDLGVPAAASLRSCAGILWEVAGDLLWAGGCHPLLLRAGRSLDSAGLTGPAVAYWRELVVVSDRVLGPGHPDTLVVGDQLARACLADERPGDAVPWFEWVLTRRVRAPGPDHPDTVAARRNLGRALLLAGQADDAVTVLDEAVGDYERVRGTDHPDTLAARGELAAAYTAAGQFGPAVQLLELTLQQLERRAGPRHPGTMTARQTLAEAYLAGGRAKDAVSSYKQTLADRERVLGADHLQTIATRAGLGTAHQAAGRITATLQLYEQASAGYERVLGADHPTTLAHRAKLADAYYAAGRLTDATGMLRDTLTRCERALPAGDPLTRSVREGLAELLGG